MASENSFDIVSSVDVQEVDNAVQQALKEIGQRYDFKGCVAEIRREEDALVLAADDEFRLKALTEILTRRLAGRKVPLKALTFQTLERAMGDTVRQRVLLQRGIAQDHAKEIVRILKGSHLKVQAAIQGDQIRVRGKNRDDLQAAIQLLREQTLPFDMQFTNYR